MALVSIVMGSDSDLKVMSQAADILEQFGISYEMNIISAHRLPDVFYKYAETCMDKGIRIIIAGAGGAAHLPGMTAALTPLPVIGVPISTKNLQGMDSVLSILQMPSGVPVATMAIDGAKNAALFAIRMLAISDPSLYDKLAAYKKEIRGQLLDKDIRIKDEGYKTYLEEMNVK